MDEVDLGARCKALLADPATGEIFERLGAAYTYQAMHGTDEEALEARRMFRALGRVQHDMRNAVTMGEIRVKQRKDGTA